MTLFTVNGISLGAGAGARTQIARSTARRLDVRRGRGRCIIPRGKTGMPDVESNCVPLTLRVPIPFLPRSPPPWTLPRCPWYSLHVFPCASPAPESVLPLLKVPTILIQFPEAPPRQPWHSNRWCRSKFRNHANFMSNFRNSLQVPSSSPGCLLNLVYKALDKEDEVKLKRFY